jgi:hypothetical protein
MKNDVVAFGNDPLERDVSGVRVEREVRPQYSGQFQYIDNLAVLKQQPSMAEANVARTQILMTATVRIERILRASTPT